MSWLKEVIVDILVTLFIIASLFVDETWIAWVIGIYTVLMLLTKTLVLTANGLQQLIKKSGTSAPEWFAHLLYGINTAALLYAQWWYLAAGWALIWFLSFEAQRRLNLKKQV